MDEPKETQDENTSENTEETSNKEPETFTKEDLEETRRKAKSDALAETGRLKKATEDAIRVATRANERVEQILKDQDDAELAAHEGNQEVISAIKERQKRRTVESELATAKQELDEEKAKTAEAQEAETLHTKERNAREVASRLGVDVKTLVKFTDGSTEAMEELAKSLPKKSETKTLLPDSSKTIMGTGRTYKRDDITSLLNPAGKTPKEIHDLTVEIEKASAEGRIK